VTLRYVVAPRVLEGAHAGLDVAASASRYAALLRDAFAAELDVPVEVVVGDRPGVEGADEVLALRVEGIARAVRHCRDWVVYETWE